MKQDRAALTRVLAEFSAAQQATFAGWTRAERIAFLINAYNVWTPDLILGRYPDLESIRDLGSLLRSPWKKSFVRLLGGTRAGLDRARATARTLLR